MKLKANSFIITWMIFLTLIVSCTKDKVTYIAPPNCPDTISFNSDIYKFYYQRNPSPPMAVALHFAVLGPDFCPFSCSIRLIDPKSIVTHPES